MIETKIFAHLNTSTAITITSSISTRIYPIIVPQESAYPAITYTRISGGIQNDLQGYSNLENPLIVIDVWAASYKEAKNLSTRVHTVMGNATGFSALLISDGDDFIPEIEIYKISMDFSCWNKE